MQVIEGTKIISLSHAINFFPFRRYYFRGLMEEIFSRATIQKCLCTEYQLI
jgi:hypothetical protein